MRWAVLGFMFGMLFTLVSLIPIIFLPQLQESRCFKKRIRKLEDANKKLALELEHEKGKLAGLTQSHSALRDHSNILESALAKREADLVQLNLQVKGFLKCFHCVLGRRILFSSPNNRFCFHIEPHLSTGSSCTEA